MGELCPDVNFLVKYGKTEKQPKKKMKKESVNQKITMKIFNFTRTKILMN